MAFFDPANPDLPDVEDEGFNPPSTNGAQNPVRIPGAREYDDRLGDEDDYAPAMADTSCATPPISMSKRCATPRTPKQGAEVMDDAAEKAHASAVIEKLTAAASSKKKRGHKTTPLAAMKTTHGFTPATPGDEDSERSPGLPRGRRSPNASRSSSLLRKDLHLGTLSGTGMRADGRSSSPAPGASALSQQIERVRSRSQSARPQMASQLASEAGSPSVTSASSGSDDGYDTANDEQANGTTSYEVPLEHDFVSSAVPETDRRDAITKSDRMGSVVRKMQATDFEPLRCLGKGTYGTVILVKQHSTGKLFAQKQFRKASLTVRKKLVEQTKTERNILESVNRHPFVVKLFYAFQDHEKLYLILEYAQGGELFERMRNEHMFPEQTAAFYLAEMVLALSHLHQTVGVVYRDLKPENCLLDAEGHLLLTDFGLSKVAADGEQCRSMTGTVEYMAPEVIMEQEYGSAVDWWSLGILGYDLLTGSSPFHAANDMKIREKILKAKLQLPYYLSPDAKDLLTRLLRKEPKKRLGACMPKDLTSIQQHRFFRKIDWKKLARRECLPPIQPVITDPALAENFADEFTSLALSPPVVTANGLATGGIPRAFFATGPASATAVDLANGDTIAKPPAPAPQADAAVSGGLPGTISNAATTTMTAAPAVTTAAASTTATSTTTTPLAASSDPSTNPFGGFSFVASQSLLEENLNL